MTRDELDSYLLAGSSSLVSLALTSSAGVAPDDAAISAWLDYPIGDALRAVGYPSASFSGVVDGDLALVPDDDSHKLLTYALWRMKIQLRGRLVACDMTQGPQSQKLSQLATSLDAEIDRLKAELTSLYPALFASTLKAGRIRLGSTSRRASESSTEMG